MIALELPDTKGRVIQPDPAPPKPTSRARRMAPDRSETRSLVMMLDAWLCPVLGLTPKRLATPTLSRPAANNPRTSVSRSVSSGKGDEALRGRSAEAYAPRSGTEECLTTSDYPYGGDDLVRSGLSVWPYAPAWSAPSTLTSSHIVRTRARVASPAAQVTADPQAVGQKPSRASHPSTQTAPTTIANTLGFSQSVAHYPT